MANPAHPTDGPLRAFLHATTRNADTLRGAIQMYVTLAPAQRDVWIEHVQRCARSPGPGLGLAVLSLLSVERDEGRRRKLCACAAEPPFAMHRSVPVLLQGNAEYVEEWRLVRPWRCEFSSVSTVRFSNAGRVLWAQHDPWRVCTLEEPRFEGVPLAEAVELLALRAAHDPAPLRAALLPFVELFSLVPPRMREDAA